MDVIRRGKPQHVNLHVRCVSVNNEDTRFAVVLAAARGVLAEYLDG